VGSDRKGNQHGQAVQGGNLKRIAPIDYAPVLFTSVPDKQRIYQTIETAVKVYKNRSQRVPTSALNDALLPAIEHYPPPSLKGKYVKIKYITQLPTKTPTFAFFCNLPQYIKEPYERYLENQIRKNFDFEGVPINTVFRKK
jgi:GTP-binding protein